MGQKVNPHGLRVGVIRERSVILLEKSEIVEPFAVGTTAKF